MIKESFLIEDDSEKSDKNDSLIKAYNEKGLFPFSLDNPSTAFTNNISSPPKKLNDKQNIEFSSLKKDFIINDYNFGFSENKLLDFIYGLPPNLLESGQKDYFNSPKDICGKKRIRQQFNNSFEGINKEKEKEQEGNLHSNTKTNNLIEKKDNSKINIIISDDFFNLLDKIFNKGGLETEKLKGNDNRSNLPLKQNSYNNNNKIVKVINFNISKNNSNLNEQICCICLKSKCLNYYCRCRKNGNICNKNCRCSDCMNNIKYNKTTELKAVSVTNGCKCKNSNCLLQYCNCKRKGIPCSYNCLCSKCKNLNECP